MPAGCSFEGACPSSPMDRSPKRLRSSLVTGSSNATAPIAPRRSPPGYRRPPAPAIRPRRMRTCGRSRSRGRSLTSRSPLRDRELEDLLRDLTPQVLAALVRRYGHFDLAEDAVQEGLLAAAMQWEADGIAQDPKAWLITVASHKLTDLLRSEQARQRREERVPQ